MQRLSNTRLSRKKLRGFSTLLQQKFIKVKQAQDQDVEIQLSNSPVGLCQESIKSTENDK
jgi:hypothetical protein